jgi:hypothetical protein
VIRSGEDVQQAGSQTRESSKHHEETARRKQGTVNYL